MLFWTNLCELPSMVGLDLCAVQEWPTAWGPCPPSIFAADYCLDFAKLVDFCHAIIYIY